MSNLRGLSESPIKSQGQTLPSDVRRGRTLKDFMSLIKIGIVNSNMITAFTGLWLALHFSGLRFLNNLDIVFYTLLGSSLIIAGSCVINNYVDRDIDPYMERTKERPTARGEASPLKVLSLGVLFIILGILFLSMTTFSAVLIGLIGVFSYVVLYTIWSKRRYVSNTIIGAISGAVPPLIGWAAVDPDLDIIAWCLFLLMFLWQPPHFYSLAMRRAEEYKAAKIPMLPVIKGFKRARISIMAWVIFLFPIPFFLYEIGWPFVMIGTLLNAGWLIIGLKDYKKEDDIRWAKRMFVYSLQYMTIMFVSMVIVTLI